MFTPKHILPASALCLILSGNSFAQLYEFHFNYSVVGGAIFVNHDLNPGEVSWVVGELDPQWITILLLDSQKNPILTFNDGNVIYNVNPIGDYMQFYGYANHPLSAAFVRVRIHEWPLGPVIEQRDLAITGLSGSYDD